MDQPLSLESEPKSQSDNERKSSQESQLKMSALDSERVSLQELNDRLQTYIEVMRSRADFSITGEQANLPTLSKQIDLIKAKYEEVITQKDEMNGDLLIECSDLRKNCEELKKSNKDLTNEVNRLENSVTDLTKKLKTLDIGVKSKDVQIYDQRNKIAEMKQNLNDLNGEFLRLKHDLVSKNDEIHSTTEKNEFLKATVESLKEKTRFLESLHKDELNAAYQTIDELRESSLQEERENSQDINELRKELQEELDNAKMNVIAAYKSSLAEKEEDLQNLRYESKELNDKNNKLQHELSLAQHELETEKDKTDQLKTYLKNLQKDNEITMKNLRDKNDCLEKRLSETNEKLEKLMMDYEKLVSDHVHLDTELNVYQTLLDSEEKRLGICMEEIRNKSFQYKLTSLPGKRLKITNFDEQSAHSITLFNTSNKNFTLTGFKLRMVQDDKVADYEMPKITIPSMETCTLASSHYVSKPDEIFVVLEDLESFAPVDGEISFTILNKKDEMVLSGKINRCSTSVSYLSSPSVSRSRKRKLNKSKLDKTSPLKRSPKNGKGSRDLRNNEMQENSRTNNGCNVM